ncbi:MAG: helix-turn-helix domain-containing protein [Methanobacteriota archaeon]
MKNFPKLKAPYRGASIETIMDCMFGLKNFETEIYFELINRDSLTVNELVSKFGKDRSTVQRALKNLIAAGLVYREQKNIKNGGYYYVYHVAKFDSVKDTIKTSVKEWADAVIGWIDSL